MKRLLTTALILASTSAMATPHLQIGNPKLDGLEQVGYCTTLAFKLGKTEQKAWGGILLQDHTATEQVDIGIGSGYAQGILDTSKYPADKADKLYYRDNCEVIKEKNL